MEIFATFEQLLNFFQQIETKSWSDCSHRVNRVIINELHVQELENTSEMNVFPYQ